MTPDDEPLLAAARAAPAGDLPRLVFADWLDETGRPGYAAFVRECCRAGESDAPDDRRRGLWPAAAAELFGEADDAVYERFAAGRGVPPDDDGELAVSAGFFVRTSGRWRPVLPVRRLTLRPLTGLERAVADAPYLDRLTALTVDVYPVDEFVSGAFLRHLAARRLPHLTGLTVDPLRVGRPDMEAFAAAPFLPQLADGRLRLLVWNDGPEYAIRQVTSEHLDPVTAVRRSLDDLPPAEPPDG